jgi:hypothetical protein
MTEIPPIVLEGDKKTDIPSLLLGRKRCGMLLFSHCVKSVEGDFKTNSDTKIMKSSIVAWAQQEY